jgi:PAS domain S-box-containing protein
VLTAADLLRAVNRGELPGELRPGPAGTLGWERGTLSIPVPGRGTLLVETAEPDETLLAAAESAGALLSLRADRNEILDAAFESVIAMDADGKIISANRAAARTFGYPVEQMIGRPVAEVIIPPALREAHRAGLARYLRTGRGPIVGRRVEVTAQKADGTEIPVELVVTRPPSGIFYGHVRDLSGRYATEAALHRLADEQAALRRVATAVAARADSARLFALVSEEVGRLLEAQAAHMFRFDPGGSGGTIVGGWALQPEHVLPNGTCMPLDGNTASVRVWRTGRAARMDDYASADGELAQRMQAYGVQAVVAAPIFLGGSLWGAVIVSSMEPKPFPPDAEERMSHFAELAAQALANAQAHEELAASRARIVQAGDEERRRLERNLHDGAQQRLVSLALMLRLAARRHPEDGELARAGDELAQALQELRELARGIHPAVLTERGLEPAVRALADRSPVPVELDVALTGRLPAPVEVAAYYVVSEALANVAKYAAASAVRVRIWRTADEARIEVADDGAGGADPNGGSGLRGLADRVEALGGRLTIDSPPGAGTTLRAEIAVSSS